MDTNENADEDEDEDEETNRMGFSLSNGSERITTGPSAESFFKSNGGMNDSARDPTEYL